MLSITDTRLVTGLGISAMAFSSLHSLSTYHFTIVVDLAWLTSNSHTLALDAKRREGNPHSCGHEGPDSIHYA